MNGISREKVEAAHFVEKMVESPLKWFVYVWRRSSEASIKKVERIEDSPLNRG